MKKVLPLLLSAALLGGTAQAQRYLSEVFTGVTKTANVTYANNLSLLSGTPVATDIKMDIYEPTGDTATKRPLVILMHTGNYLPIIINTGPQGTKTDSTIVEIANRMARRGYVVASIDYRLGWNPQGSNVDIRRGTLINAVFRSIQDVHSCVRWFRKNVATGGNTYKIDSSKVILGGQGTGGYIALNYPGLHDSLQIMIPKFISNINDATYGFQIGRPYVNLTAFGDFEGYGGVPTFNNPNNSPGYTSNVQFVFNLGGALGDSTWLTAGLPPMVSFHVRQDPNAPYGNGMVYVPLTPPQPVVEVSGSGYVIPKAVALGNNDCFKNKINDSWTTIANSRNGGADGLFPINVASVDSQSGPWEWFDSTATVNTALALGLPASSGTNAYLSGLAQNHGMSKAKAMAYIDTVMGYLNPRIYTCLLKPVGVHEVTRDNSVKIFPNPASETITIRTGLQGNLIREIRIADLSGRIVKSASGIQQQQYTVNRDNLSPGLYLISVETVHGRITQKLTIE